MNVPVRLSLLTVALAIAAPNASARFEQPRAAAHFRLLEPASWLVEDERGDPQKAGPCGGSNNDWGEESYIITPVEGGSMMPLRVRETIYHPGHYRVALAVNSPTELPLDPVTETIPSDRGPWSVSAEIQDPAEPPVLADGLFVHNERPDEIQTYETDIRIPNINCDKCILQVIQWMADHAYNNPGGYSYHHCAHLAITANPDLPIDTGWPEQM